MKKTFLKIIPVLLIISLFLGGFGIGLKQDFFFKPKEAKAQLENPGTPIHQDDFRKIVIDYLRNHKVLCRDRNGNQIKDTVCQLSWLGSEKHKGNMVEKLTAQLDLDNYFSSKNSQAQRLDYLQHLSQNKHKEVLNEHLVQGFEKKYNYFYYDGNIREESIAQLLDGSLYNLSKNWLSLPDTWLEGLNMGGYWDVKNMVIDPGPVVDPTKCQNMRDSGCLTAKMTDVWPGVGDPRLREKHELTPSQKKKLYDAPIMALYRVYQNLPEWNISERQFFDQWLMKGVQNYIKILISKGVPYKDAVGIVMILRAADKTGVAAGIIGLGAGAVTGKVVKGVAGLAISRATRNLTYDWAPEAVAGTMDAVTLRFMTAKTAATEAVPISGDASNLTIDLLKPAAQKIYQILDDVQKSMELNVFKGDWKLVINRNLKVYQTVEGETFGIKADGEIFPAIKTIYLNQNVVEKGVREDTIVRLALHGINPNFNDYFGREYIKHVAWNWSVNDSSIKGKAIPGLTDFFGPEITAYPLDSGVFKLHFFYPLNSTDVPGGVTLKCMSTVIKNPLNGIANVDYAYGEGFVARFESLVSRNVRLKIQLSQGGPAFYRTQFERVTFDKTLQQEIQRNAREWTAFMNSKPELFPSECPNI